MNLPRHKIRPIEIQADPINIPVVNGLSCSKMNVDKITNSANKKRITAAMIFTPSLKTLVLLLIAKANTNAPANINSNERISCNQIYLLNKLFI